MTHTSNPRDNVIAERVNGTITNEYPSSYQVDKLKEGKEVLDFVILLYYEERQHMSLGNRSPTLVQAQKSKPEQPWRNYYQKTVVL